MAEKPNNEIGPRAQYLHGSLLDAREHAKKIASKHGIGVAIAESWQRAGEQRYRVLCPQHTLSSNEVVIERYSAGTGELLKPQTEPLKGKTFNFRAAIAKHQKARAKGRAKALGARKFSVTFDVLGEPELSPHILKGLIDNALAGYGHTSGTTARLTYFNIEERARRKE